MFLLSCVIAVLCVDPWFLYLPVINQDDKCLTLDKRLMVTALCLRWVIDMVCVGIIILGYSSRKPGQIGLDQVDQKPWQKIKRCLKLNFTVAIDILAILPIPEVRKTFLLPILFFFFFFFLKFNYAMRHRLVVIYITVLSCLCIRYVDSVPLQKGFGLLMFSSSFGSSLIKALVTFN
jgi:hypothetical protein